MTLSFPSPETIARAELPNGITLLVYENHSSPAVVIGGYVWAGSLSEPDEKAGLAAFTAGMLMRGTENRTFGQINETLESVGAQLGFRMGAKPWLRTWICCSRSWLTACNGLPSRAKRPRRCGGRS